MSVTEMGLLRDQWIAAVRDLADQISHWARESGWSVRRSEEEVAEEDFGAYLVPVLTMDTPEGRLILEPQAANAGGKGRVKLYAASTLYRVRLLRGDTDGEWTILTDSGIPLWQPWSKETFVRLAHDLLAAS